MHIFIKMRKDLSREIEIPEGVEFIIEGSSVIVKGTEGENKKKFDLGKLALKKEGNTIKVGHEKSTKNEKKMMNTIVAHLKNMIAGVQKKFEYKLKVASSHFPITVKLEGNRAIIKNFLGEKVDRICDIPTGAEVKIDKDIITITSVDREIAGQASANFEAATKVRNRDRRIFQDGIYITSKAGEEI